MSTLPGTELRVRSSVPESRSPGLRSMCASHAGFGGSVGNGPAPTSSSRHLKLLDPPFTTRILIGSGRPLPIADFRQIVAVFIDIQLVFDQLIAQPLFG